MSFKTTINPVGVIAGALVGALVILVGGWISGDFDSGTLAIALGFVIGELTCLSVAFSNRERKANA